MIDIAGIVQQALNKETAAAGICGPAGTLQPVSLAESSELVRRGVLWGSDADHQEIWKGGV